MKKLAIAVAIVSLGAVALIATAIAKNGNGEGGRSFHAKLNGYNEVVGGNGPDTGSVSTLARGTFKARVRNNPLRVEWELTYSGIEGGDVTAAHPHFAQRHVGGGVFTVLCGAPKPPCPATAGTVTGTITEADIIGPANQGVQAGATFPGDDALMEFIRAMRAGAVYVNVHSPGFSDGEIRGQINGGGDNGRGHGKRDKDD
jgi:CHRD domain